jgi:hypothetical protein
MRFVCNILGNFKMISNKPENLAIIDPAGCDMGRAYGIKKMVTFWLAELDSDVPDLRNNLLICRIGIEKFVD